jgi:hypothetical protein
MARIESPQHSPLDQGASLNVFIFASTKFRMYFTEKKNFVSPKTFIVPYTYFPFSYFFTFLTFSFLSRLRLYLGHFYNTHTRIYTHTHTRTHACTHTHAHTRTHTHLHAHTHAHTRLRTHTHTQTLNPVYQFILYNFCQHVCSTY